RSRASPPSPGVRRRRGVATTAISAQTESRGPRARAAGGGARSDRVFVGLVTGLATAAVVVFVALLVLLLVYAWTAITRYGFSFFTTTTWDPVFQEFGAAAFIYGTLVTSIVALIVATPIAVGAALFVAEYAPKWLGEPVGFVVELLAVIPSIIYGLWGLFVLAPAMGNGVEAFLKDTVGRVPVIGPLFSGPLVR